MTYLVACEEFGLVRDALLSRGIDAISCDIKPTDSPGPHIQDDVRNHLHKPWRGIVAFPECTYLTCSAEWAYSDPDYSRFPGVGYHQRVSDTTKVGHERREARLLSIEFVKLIWNSNKNVIIENPVGVLSRHLGSPQVIQPYMFGEDASKATCVWIKGFPKITIPPESEWFPPRLVNGKKRWSNQTDTGQNRLSPGPNRARLRGKTYQGVAEALARVVEQSENT